MLGQAASSGFTPMVSICSQINLLVLYFINYSLKTCKVSKGQTFSSSLCGMYLCIYTYLYRYDREKIYIKIKRGGKGQLFF